MAKIEFHEPFPHQSGFEACSRSRGMFVLDIEAYHFPSSKSSEIVPSELYMVIQIGFSF